MLSVRAVRDGGLHLSILELPPAFPKYSGRALVGSPGVSLGVLSGVFGPWAGYPRVVPPKFPQGSLKPWSPGVPRPKQTRNRNMKLSPEQTTKQTPKPRPRVSPVSPADPQTILPQTCVFAWQVLAPGDVWVSLSYTDLGPDGPQ